MEAVAFLRLPCVFVLQWEAVHTPRTHGDRDCFHVAKEELHARALEKPGQPLTQSGGTPLRMPNQKLRRLLGPLGL